jgi:hypothetical protein
MNHIQQRDQFENLPSMPQIKKSLRPPIQKSNQVGVYRNNNDYRNSQDYADNATRQRAFTGVNTSQNV